MSDQIDYFLLYTNQAAAEADAAILAGDSFGPYWSASGGWRPDVVFPGISVVTPQALINGVSSITGFWLLISSPALNAALAASPNFVMCLDRSLAPAGSFVLNAVISGSNRTSLQLHPVPAGAGYSQPLGK